MLLSHFLSSPADRPRLRIGLILDGTTIARYALEVVQQIQQAAFTRIEVAVLSGPSGRQAASALFRLYQRWDARQIREAADPLALVDATKDLAGIPALLRRAPSGDPAADAARQVRDLRLDVIVDLRSDRSGPELSLSALYGVWRLRHTAESRYAGGPSAFWEVCESNPLSGAALEVHGAAGSSGPVVLSRCVVATSPGLSWASNRLAPFWAVNPFVIQKLRELHADGWPALTRRAVTVPPAVSSGPTRGAPTSAEMVRWLVPILTVKAARRLVRRPARLEWRIALRQSDRPLLEREAADRASGFRWLTAPEGRALADPFLIAHGGQTWLFVEDISIATGRGRIAVTELAADGKPGEFRPVLERAYHLSYPCVFMDHGEWFMIPESSKNGTVELFRSRRFPDDWVPERVLLNVPAVDTNIWVEDGRYWFFTTLLDERSRTGQLWLFSAESLTGTWSPHPENPISADVRNNRGAGAMFRHRGRLYRPSQDGSGRYGRTFSLNEITELTPDRYAERAVVTVEPEPGCLGTHSYAWAGRFELLDGRFVLPASQ